MDLDMGFMAETCFNGVHAQKDKASLAVPRDPGRRIFATLVEQCSLTYPDLHYSAMLDAVGACGPIDLVPFFMRLRIVVSVTKSLRVGEVEPLGRQHLHRNNMIGNHRRLEASPAIAQIPAAERVVGQDNLAPTVMGRTVASTAPVQCLAPARPVVAA